MLAADGHILKMFLCDCHLPRLQNSETPNTVMLAMQLGNSMSLKLERLFRKTQYFDELSYEFLQDPKLNFASVSFASVVHTATVLETLQISLKKKKESR
jgi:hypothetical protein